MLLLAMMLVVAVGDSVFAQPGGDAEGRTFLVSGFEPFGKEKINPSYEAVKRLPDVIEGVKIVKLEVPVTWDHTKGVSSVRTLIEAIEKFHPDAILMTGQHGGFAELAIERYGHNKQKKSKDNNGVAGSGGKDPVLLETDPDASNLYRTTLPNTQIVKAIKEAGVPAILNTDPGEYICEHVIYRIGHYLSLHSQSDGKEIPYGFIHVPYMSGQAQGNRNARYMSLDNMVKGIETAVIIIIRELNL
jgi:pyroglutamyl-peptidase